MRLDFHISECDGKHNTRAGNYQQKNLPEMAGGPYIGAQNGFVPVSFANKAVNGSSEANIGENGNHSLNSESYRIDGELGSGHQSKQQESGRCVEQLDAALPADKRQQSLPDSRDGAQSHKLPTD
ncbi:MAG: hypothetical protein ABR898_09365 [Terracidiphilus sp.]